MDGTTSSSLCMKQNSGAEKFKKFTPIVSPGRKGNFRSKRICHQDYFNSVSQLKNFFRMFEKIQLV